MIRIKDLDPESELMDMCEYIKDKFNLKWQDFKGVDMSYQDENDDQWDRIWIYYWKDKKCHYVMRVDFTRREWNEYKMTGKDF